MDESGMQGCRPALPILGEATQQEGDQQASHAVRDARAEAHTAGGPRSGGSGATSERRCGRAGSLATGWRRNSRLTASAVSAGVCSPNARQMPQEWWLCVPSRWSFGGRLWSLPERRSAGCFCVRAEPCR